MAKSVSPYSYADVYEFFRERCDGPIPRRPRTEAELERLAIPPDAAQEAWFWDSGLNDEPMRRRGYPTDCGFSLIYHPETIFHGGYTFVAPSNTVSFATTGGDGCHFSFITRADGSWSADCPIVLIVPAGYGDACVVVGANLWEFLCLGRRTGYFVLENLSGRLDEFIAEYPSADPVGNDARVIEMTAFAQRFGLVSWEREDIRPRLDALREQFFPLLVFPEEET